jgi:hypothetical protein
VQTFSRAGYGQASRQEREHKQGIIQAREEAVHSWPTVERGERGPNRPGVGAPKSRDPSGGVGTNAGSAAWRRQHRPINPRGRKQHTLPRRPRRHRRPRVMRRGRWRHRAARAGLAAARAARRARGDGAPRGARGDRLVARRLRRELGVRVVRGRRRHRRARRVLRPPVRVELAAGPVLALHRQQAADLAGRGSARAPGAAAEDTHYCRARFSSRSLPTSPSSMRTSAARALLNSSRY